MALLQAVIADGDLFVYLVLAMPPCWPRTMLHACLARPVCSSVASSG